MIPFDFWVVGVSFSFCGHDTDTYRTVSVGHGAFELCLPSLGFFFTKLTLRCRYLGQRHRMTKVGTLGSRTVWNNMRCLPCEVSVADVLGVSQEAYDDAVEQE